MRLAILYETGSVCVEFKPEVFLDLLKTYIDQCGSVDAAFEKIQNELKNKTKYT